MKHKAKFVLSLAAVTVVACGSSVTDPTPSTSFRADLRGAVCSPSVSRDGDVVQVLPTGADDTANLQCAIDAAVAARHPMSIRLAAGTFHTAQLVAKGFVGQQTDALSRNH